MTLRCLETRRRDDKKDLEAGTNGRKLVLMTKASVHITLRVGLVRLSDSVFFYESVRNKVDITSRLVVYNFARLFIIRQRISQCGKREGFGRMQGSRATRISPLQI